MASLSGDSGPLFNSWVAVTVTGTSAKIVRINRDRSRLWEGTIAHVPDKGKLDLKVSSDKYNCTPPKWNSMDMEILSANASKLVMTLTKPKPGEKPAWLPMFLWEQSLRNLLLTGIVTIEAKIWGKFLDQS